jgi:bacillithiol system protein YtxJ
MAKSKVERQWADAGLSAAKIYYLDLLRFRPISQEIAQKFNVHHESPQLLLIQNGECTLDSSHMAIKLSEVKELVK